HTVSRSDCRFPVAFGIPDEPDPRRDLLVVGVRNTIAGGPLRITREDLAGRSIRVDRTMRAGVKVRLEEAVERAVLAVDGKVRLPAHAITHSQARGRLPRILGVESK